MSLDVYKNLSTYKPLEMKQCGSCFAYFVKRGPHSCEPGKIQLVERSIRGMRGMLLPY